ncbi:MAG: tRNA (adenosine(37)-N6)-threonylcarbamoyltransferase complex ATPase subunit type 1 TsaE [Candidatus Latescibacterota bacterium]|nr:MAG: tRNA (adenosine(37)-N6)-threonylcarbamoyltransferase complex ATPase subunit type 1 TsaE [Candidatus Latescibacterota bacterium]
MSEIWSSRSPAETEALGERFGRTLRGGEIVLLCGDLGVGKTQFAQGIGRALGVTAPIVSPTFTLAVHYQGNWPLVHYDLYRVESAEELMEIGFLEEEDERAVRVVEWGDRLPQPRNAIRVQLTIETDATRRIEVHAAPEESA